MRLVPRSLSGRLVLVVMAILVTAQLSSLGIHMHERGELLLQASGMRAAQQIADIVELFDSTSPADRRRIAQVLSRPPLVVSVERTAITGDPAAGTRAAFFGAMLRRTLGEDRALTVRITEGGETWAPPQWKGGAGPGRMDGIGPMGSGRMDGSGPRGPGMHYLAQPGVVLLAQVRLRDGSLVTFESGQPVETSSWPYRVLASIGILLAAAIGVAFIAVRWATRPLATLAIAAEALGRNVNRPPLPEDGPIEVARAARAFNTMQTQLATYVRTRTQLLAAMSHDLKTPITRLRLRSELLDDARLREKYETDLQEMEAMVGSTLEFLRGLEADEPARPLDVMSMLETLQADRQEMGARVTIEGIAAIPYTGQRLALRRALGNLLDNAIKYGKGAAVFVHDDAQRLSIRICDEGPGIPDGELEKVFEPFYRLESSRSRDTGGTGLGLAIARQIARAHGGDVKLANRPGGGLEAVLELPRIGGTPATP
jgi:signal transduction histidine kinase